MTVPPSTADTHGRGTTTERDGETRRDPVAGAARGDAPLDWRDRLLEARNRLYASAAFQRWAGRLPFIRAIARRRSRAVFDLCAGFVYSQVLTACVRLDLFVRLADGPRSLDALAELTALPADRLRRLVDAAASLQLLEWRSGDRVGLGSLGAPLATNRAVATLVEHHALFYEDIRDPVALLRGGAREETALAGYWPYAGAGEASHALPSAGVTRYSETMAATLPPLAEEVLDAYDFGRHRVLMDVGGGEGVFAAAAAQRWSGLQCRVFDLPAVAQRASRRFALHGLAARTSTVGGNFLTDALPPGADVVTLVRVLLDHKDADAELLLRRVRAALAPGGRLVIAEAFAGAKGAEPVGAAYFGLYLMAMGGGRARPVAEYQAMLQAAGFRRSWQLTTRYPIQTGLLVAEAW